MRKAPPQSCGGAFQAVEKLKLYTGEKLFPTKPNALGRVLPPAGGEIKSKSEKSEDMCLGFFSAQTLECANGVSARESLHLLEKMLAFLRSVSNCFDTLKSPAAVLRRGFCHYFCSTVSALGSSALGAGAALGAAGLISGTLPSTVMSFRGHFWAHRPQPTHLS